MTGRMSGVLKWHHAVLLLLLAVGSAGLYHVVVLGVARLESLSWEPKVPDLPGAPQPMGALQTVPALAITRERPLFWETRRVPQPKVVVPVVEPPRLIGVIIQPDGGNIALLAQGVGAQRRVTRLRAGQSLNGFTIQTISKSGVELSGPSGAQTLSLPRQVTN